MPNRLLRDLRQLTAPLPLRAQERGQDLPCALPELYASLALVDKG